MIADVPENCRTPNDPRFQIISPYPELKDSIFDLKANVFFQRIREGKLRRSEQHIRGSTSVEIPASNAHKMLHSGNAMERALHSEDVNRFPLHRETNQSSSFVHHGSEMFIPPEHGGLSKPQAFAPSFHNPPINEAVASSFRNPMNEAFVSSNLGPLPNPKIFLTSRSDQLSPTELFSPQQRGHLSLSEGFSSEHWDQSKPKRFSSEHQSQISGSNTFSSQHHDQVPRVNRISLQRHGHGSGIFKPHHHNQICAPEQSSVYHHGQMLGSQPFLSKNRELLPDPHPSQQFNQLSETKTSLPGQAQTDMFFNQHYSQDNRSRQINNRFSKGHSYRRRSRFRK